MTSVLESPVHRQSTVAEPTEPGSGPPLQWTEQNQQTLWALGLSPLVMWVHSEATVPPKAECKHLQSIYKARLTDALTAKAT